MCSRHRDATEAEYRCHHLQKSGKLIATSEISWTSEHLKGRFGAVCPSVSQTFCPRKADGLDLILARRAHCALHKGRGGRSCSFPIISKIEVCGRFRLKQETSSVHQVQWSNIIQRPTEVNAEKFFVLKQRRLVWCPVYKVNIYFKHINYVSLQGENLFQTN